jgi:predicted glycosyltransferase involved in capsule biosynthesis
MINQSLHNILINNYIDYDKLKNNFSKCEIFDKDHFDINVIIPVRGRLSFANPTYQSFKKARDKSKLKISYTIVEISDQNEHENFCLNNKINYIWIKTEPEVLFNKCLALNIGAMFTVSSNSFIFHDIDCLMQSDFFLKLEDNIKNKNAKAIQCFTKRRLLYLNDILTEKIINNDIEIDNLTIETNGVRLPEYIGAPGGSIYTTRDLFFNVGGFDPELFQGNAPEDVFYWEKISMIDTMYISNDPEIELYHMSHPVTCYSNPKISEMISICNTFIYDNYHNKLELVIYKKNLINAYNI